MEKTDSQGSCTYKQGSLPECAPLALSQIPPQQSSENRLTRAQKRSPEHAFPGLDLPLQKHCESDARRHDGAARTHGPGLCYGRNWDCIWIHTRMTHRPLRPSVLPQAL